MRQVAAIGCRIPSRVSKAGDQRASVIILLPEEQQKSGKDQGAEHKEIGKSNDRQPDPERFFLIGYLVKDVRIAGYVLFMDGIAYNNKEEKDEHE
jgi:hypothetical protein